MVKEKEISPNGTLTKEQIADFQRSQIQDFLQRLNEFLDGQDFTVVPVPFVDGEGRIKARLEVAAK